VNREACTAFLSTPISNLAGWCLSTLSSAMAARLSRPDTMRGGSCGVTCVAEPDRRLETSSVTDGPER